VSKLFPDGARELQDHFDTRRIADRLQEVTVHDAFTADDRAFIERMDMFFLATADAAPPAPQGHRPHRARRPADRALPRRAVRDWARDALPADDPARSG
jgi:hypothetical protein